MLNLTSLENQLLQPGTKGLALSAPLPLRDLAAQNWNLLEGDTSFPVAVLKQSALQNNIRWMEMFCEQRQILLAPHGKTTMSPQLFDLQIRHGAWGITLANVNQMCIAQRFGVRRVILANQLVSRSDIVTALNLLQQHQDFTFYALCDSADGIRLLEEQISRIGLQRPLNLLVELGYPGGRTGCRTVSEALTLARQIHASPYLQLAGIEAYEGLFVSQSSKVDADAVQCMLQDLLDLTGLADREQLFDGDEILISAGGSAYFDLVGSYFLNHVVFSRKLLPVLRSGCYITHDHGFYHGLIERMRQRDNNLPVGELQPALEVWSMVQSRPEPDLAILTMGKRDVSYDIEMPLPIFTHRPGAASTPVGLPAGCKIEKMNDQHAYLRLPRSDSLCTTLAVGDLIACGVSHPCTTFDKWQLILIVDDQYRIQSAINTFF